MEQEKKELGFFTLIALVVGTMVGGGAFNLPSDMAAAANSGPVILGWLITGIGMIALVLVFHNLTNRKAELDGGIYGYSRAGFGEYLGFNSAYGYWMSTLLGNLAFFTLMFSSLSYFFPIFGEGNNLPSVIASSVLLWTVHALILSGVKEASLVNLITTIGKMIPIFVFLVLIVFAFHYNVFLQDFWGPDTRGFDWKVVKEQVKETMLVTLWTFVGVEGAVVMSGRAKKKKDVGRATVIGLLGTMTIYILISILSLGVMSRSKLADLKAPSLAYVLEHVVGPWGAVLINIGLIVSLAGALLGWTLLAIELPYVAGREGVFPRWFAKENKNGSPSASLWVSNGIVQLFIIIVLFSESTYQIVYSMASVAILLPYLFSALYQVKLVGTGETYEKGESRTKDMIIGLIASLYSIWLVYAAGLDYLLLTAVIYATGLFLYGKARAEKGEKWFRSGESLLALFILGAAVFAIYMMWTGQIQPGA
jgi:arginine:ornithine antiporter / lysine permease